MMSFPVAVVFLLLMTVVTSAVVVIIKSRRPQHKPARDIDGSGGIMGALRAGATHLPAQQPIRH